MGNTNNARTKGKRQKTSPHSKGLDNSVTKMEFLTHTPYLENWSLVFKEKDGYENIATALKAFIVLWTKPNRRKIRVRGKCLLRGDVFKQPRFTNGQNIYTSKIRTIERVQNQNAPRGLLRINTFATTYYVDLEGYNAFAPIVIEHTSPKEEEPHGFFWKRR